MKVPIFELIGAFSGSLGAEVRLRVGAGRLPVRRIRVDREAIGQGDSRRFELGRRGGEAEELRGAQLDVEARGRVGFFGRRTGIEDWVEDLQVASGRFGVFGVFAREVFGSW